jgi:hypothetical protein
VAAGGALNAALAIIAWTAVGVGLLGASYAFLLLMSRRVERRRPQPARDGSPWGEIIELPAAARNRAGGGGAKRAATGSHKDEIAPHRKAGL